MDEDRERSPLAALAARDGARHVRRLPARSGEAVDWPTWVPAELIERLGTVGIRRPWRHQAAAADIAHGGQHTVLATGTASGKTLGFWLPTLAGLMTDESATAIYLAPTKALAHDQLTALESLAIAGIRAATYDGDTPSDERRWVRAHANFIFTNPDLVHRSMLPRHTSWARVLRGLRYIIVDEAHHYRGVFGSHVALVLRRLLRVAARYGASPTVILASATMSNPEESTARLVGAPVVAVSNDTSPRGALTAVLWEPGERLPGERRSATAETADLLTDLVVEGTRTLAFVPSRRGVEAVLMLARSALAETDPELEDRVAAYRGGYLAEERRALESDLRSGRLLGVAATNALELGIDISGLDAVITAGWPGLRASLWQQWGRAGRDGQEALGLLVAREDLLDHYVLAHPEVIFDAPLESVVLDPDNRFVLGPHLTAAAAEFPIEEDEVESRFGPRARDLLDSLAHAGELRKRRTGWYWTSREAAADRIDIRGSAGVPVRIVESGTGRLLGTVESARAPSTVHAGAVYVHQGITHLVESLDLVDAVAFARPEQVDYSTTATEIADYRILTVENSVAWGDAAMSLGEVEVTSRVVGFVRRRYLTGEVLGETALDMPPQTLRTRGVWWTVSDAQLSSLGLRTELDIAGAAHAAEHASIGMMPLIAACDRWDIGGVSTPLHPDTGRCTVVVYDGNQGGAGFADRAYEVAEAWLQATRDAVAACPCVSGCPGCVQSPKCGNGNDPLDKAGAVALLDALLAGSSGRSGTG